MDDLIALASLWVAHVVIAGVVVAPVVWFTRRRVQWHWWQLAIFVIPFGVWFALLYAGWRPKTLANLGECVMISGAIAVAAIAQGFFARTPAGRFLPAALFAAVVAAAIGVYLLTPMWPE